MKKLISSQSTTSLSDFTKFEQQVLKSVNQIPIGKVTTYVYLAQAINNSKASRAVGNALHKNPWAPKVPCHRVVRSDGLIGGYGGGVKKKLLLLQSEGIEVEKNRIKNFKQLLYKF
ncbi:MAG: cysteine methyltransferase [Parcubacteria group bacterium]|nr:cysteine methyltransferase [Parcubacteria group bacterium]|tara:strand:+ start:2185 stop:2532 length:348 start_codon:yes stop_codon:yes gene_type:complete